MLDENINKLEQAILKLIQAYNTLRAEHMELQQELSVSKEEKAILQGKAVATKNKLKDLLERLKNLDQAYE